MNNNTIGVQNAAVGVNSLYTNTTGVCNNALGMNALFACTTGYNSIAIGYNALGGMTSGGNNIAIGHQAAAAGTNDITTGVNNIVIGVNGYIPVAAASNRIVLGNQSHTHLYCQQTSITLLSSDARDKKEVETIPIGLEFVNKLRPVRYKYDSRSRYTDGIPDGSKVDDFWSTGFIAQEVIAVQPDWFDLGEVFDSDHLTATPGKVLMPLVKAVQELSAQVTELKAQVAALQASGASA
jgi:hypothetical protein